MAQKAEQLQEPPTTETCAYVPIAGGRCQEPPWTESADGYCLYHAPENGKDDETARRVWDQARTHATDLEVCDCTGWHLPADPDRRGFKGVTSRGGPLFGDATFEGVARFEDATFKEAWFVGATFKGDARFDGATFKADARFDGATFKGEAGFHRAAFEGIAWFENATFGDDAVFGDATFEGDARFGDAAFGVFASFSNATVKGDAVFDGATFEGSASFDGAKALGYPIFDLPALPMPFRKASPFRKRECGETAYRLAKQSAQDRGDYRRAGDYHFAEQCAINHGRLVERYPLIRWTVQIDLPRLLALPPGKRSHQLRAITRLTVGSLAHLSWASLELVFARALFGYGEKPQRVLVAALVVIACFTGLYYGLAGMEPARLGGDALHQYQPTFRECVHFSVVTFTTLGYGDFQPRRQCWFVADAEALIGAAMMALFVVSLARRYTR